MTDNEQAGRIGAAPGHGKDLMTTTRELSKADRKRLKELQATRRNIGRNFYHPALWYGCEPAVSKQALIAEERARIDAEIALLEPPEDVPVLVGVIVGQPTQDVLW